MGSKLPACTAILLVSCPDRRGLVAVLAQLLYDRGINILDADQHTDSVAGKFFQRIHMDLEDLQADRNALEGAVAEVADRLEMRWRLAYSDHRKRMAILVSRYDHCLHDLLLRHRAGDLACDIPLIISNHPDLEQVADSHSIEFHVLPVTRDTKVEQERKLIELLEEAQIDLVVLARYMQILSPRFCARYQERAINIHHSFLPAFVGSQPYRQAQRRGVKLVGATAHYVTDDLDEGPIIAQDVMRVSHKDSVEDLVRKGRDLERQVLSRAVAHHLDDRILVYDNKTVIFE